MKFKLDLNGIFELIKMIGEEMRVDNPTKDSIKYTVAYSTLNLLNLL